MQQENGLTKTYAMCICLLPNQINLNFKIKTKKQKN